MTKKAPAADDDLAHEEQAKPTDILDYRAADTRLRNKEERKRWAVTKNALHALTPMELRFVQIMCTSPGTTYENAVREAGWKGNPKAAKQRGWRLSNRPVIKAAIHELMSRAIDSAEISIEAWVRETWGIASIPVDILAGEIRVADKLKALEMIGRQQGLMEQNAQGSQQRNIIQFIVEAGKTQIREVKQIVERSDRTDRALEG